MAVGLFWLLRGRRNDSAADEGYRVVPERQIWTTVSQRQRGYSGVCREQDQSHHASS